MKDSQKVHIISFLQMTDPIKMVTCLLIGDTGVGKSQFGNRYLGKIVFEANDNPNPVTLKPQVQSSILNDGLTRYVIDTEGHADGNSISSEQIQKLALFLQEWKQGVNGICIILNGQHDRFSQGVKDTLRWAYNTFSNFDILSHICIVFTRCYDGIPNPNQQQKKSQYHDCVLKFMMDISDKSSIQTIPMFFVDSVNLESVNTEQNMIQFHDWLITRQQLQTKNVQAVPLRDKIETEQRKRVFKCYRYSGPSNDKSRYSVYENMSRQKIIPYNGDQIRYSEWKIDRTWEEFSGRQTIEYEYQQGDLRRYEYSGSSNNQSRYAIYDQNTREKIKSYDGHVTYTNWKPIGELRQLAGNRRVETRSRQRESEEKVVEHHSGHSMGGFSRKDHTHYSINRNIWTEEWTVTTDFDGSVTETRPIRVGNVTRTTISNGREHGWTSGFERIIR
jgi:hypothetical protein